VHVSESLQFSLLFPYLPQFATLGSQAEHCDIPGAGAVDALSKLYDCVMFPSISPPQLPEFCGLDAKHLLKTSREIPRVPITGVRRDCLHGHVCRLQLPCCARKTSVSGVFSDSHSHGELKYPSSVTTRERKVELLAGSIKIAANPVGISVDELFELCGPPVRADLECFRKEPIQE
jgi:hypothetical protein